VTLAVQQRDRRATLAVQQRDGRAAAMSATSGEQRESVERVQWEEEEKNGRRRGGGAALKEKEKKLGFCFCAFS